MSENRKEWIFAGFAITAALAIVAVNSALADCGHCGHDKDKDQAKARAVCPYKVPGAEVKVINIDNGVTITITAKEPAAVKQIQEAAANVSQHLQACPSRDKGEQVKGKDAGKAKTYECPMKGCYTGEKTKDGKCPHCGMKLEKSKP
ncbi:MAG: hypothetical protein HY924_11135 [Elusimicrobia bacterium]|nr:hypothetical protein [Elusimicrobiota bacterium]